MFLLKRIEDHFVLRQPAGFDVEKHEYLCPLCECLSNTVLPLLPALGTLQPTPQNQPELDFGTWLEALKITECNPSGKLYKAQSSKEEQRFCMPDLCEY